MKRLRVNWTPFKVEVQKANDIWHFQKCQNHGFFSLLRLLLRWVNWWVIRSIVSKSIYFLKREKFLFMKINLAEKFRKVVAKFKDYGLLYQLGSYCSQNPQAVLFKQYYLISSSFILIQTLSKKRQKSEFARFGDFLESRKSTYGIRGRILDSKRSLARKYCTVFRRNWENNCIVQYEDCRFLQNGLLRSRRLNKW